MKIGVLSFDRPKKLIPTEEHAPGTYVPNMSRADQLKWRAKHITGKNERIEIRSTEPWVNLLVIVFKNPTKETNRWHPEDFGDPYYIKMSMNGTSRWSLETWSKLEGAVQEARDILGI